MIKMHKNEIYIDKNLVKKLLKNQVPHLADLPLKALSSNGTDNVLFRLGEEYIVRLPRINNNNRANESINKEFEWIRKVSSFLNIPISIPLFKGISGESYPCSWIIAKWNEGHNPDFEVENEYANLAKQLAEFINQLHSIRLSNGPTSRRGVPLKTQDFETRNAIKNLEGEIDTQTIACLWDQLSNTLPWSKQSVWIHGDLLPGNILVQNQHLSAVIDFSDLGMGDPACDLIIAWSLFNGHSRKIFRENLVDIDDAAWQRGKGWALSIALIILPYYKYTNPYLISVAKRIIENMLAE